MSSWIGQVFSAHKAGQARGLTSLCTANPDVLATAIRRAVRTGGSLLVESTCNQVNQFGGYTGLTPAGFRSFLLGLAAECALPPDRLLLGGDHLGPSAWQQEPAEAAMQKAEQLVRDCVRSGYRKIHLDASMRLGGDPAGALPLELSAERTARLAAAAEAAREPGDAALIYVIGSEVPVPGGALAHEEGVQVTCVESVQETLAATQAAFGTRGLGKAWERVAAMVVQPGVEFGDDFVLDYQPEAAAELSHFVEKTPFVYEAHSTDYQTRPALQVLVRDHFAILKVGPALTFALREAFFALAAMEAELFQPGDCSNLVAVLDQAMLSQPEHWLGHYRGSPAEQAFARKFSLSDRVRYYWADPQVQSARRMLMENLGRAPLPLVLVSQYDPRSYEKMRGGEIERTPGAVLEQAIGRVLADYEFACLPAGGQG